jgi:hypothetical protein
MSRDFATDFCIHAIKDLSPQQAARVGLALDCAILFGVLEARAGNESLQGPALDRLYLEKIARLQKL